MVIVICTQSYRNFSFSTYLFSIKKFICFDGEFQKYSLCLNRFFKNTARHAKSSFLSCIDRCEMKNVQFPLLFFTGYSLYSPSACLHEKFPYEGGHSIAHSIFRTCVQRRKDHFGLFLNTNLRSGRSKNAYHIDCSRP